MISNGLSVRQLDRGHADERQHALERLGSTYDSPSVHLMAMYTGGSRPIAVFPLQFLNDAERPDRFKEPAFTKTHRYITVGPVLPYSERAEIGVRVWQGIATYLGKLKNKDRVDVEVAQPKLADILRESGWIDERWQTRRGLHTHQVLRDYALPLGFRELGYFIPERDESDDSALLNDDSHLE
ncbi:MAG TPA: hypothetical protein VJH97_03100 [Candidatus Nanoarchaeia archaeon]|nr:hypothetical protein [Candidatus Nanoarchaeia archaeon]